MRRAQAWLDRLIQLLVRAYPAEFRARFGLAMTTDLVDDLLEARRRGLLATSWFVLTAFPSFVINGLLERIGGRSGRPLPDLLDVARREVRHAVRRLARSPGFALAALATLALGIGATVAIYSVVVGVVVRPPPYPDPDRLVVVGHSSLSNAEVGIPSAGWFYYRDRSITLASMAAYVESSTALAGSGRPLEVGMIQATPSLLGVLGISPALGRDLTEADAEPGAPAVVLVSHDWWVNHLGADSAAIGGPVLPGEDEIVVGVLPDGFRFERPRATVIFGNPFEAPDLIFPLRIDPSRARFGNFMYQALARLAPGADLQDARRELERLMPESAEAYPGAFTPAELSEGGYRPRVVTVRNAIVGDLARVLWMLFAAIGIVLAIAVANVANLFLARAESRSVELAVRRALGASRRGIAGALLTESLLLALAGGAIGTLMAALVTRPLLRLAPGGIPRVDGVGLHLDVLVFAALLSCLVGLGFGAAPIVLHRVPTPSSVGVRGATTGVRASVARRVLMVGQVGLALVLLVGAVLLIESARNLRAVDPGFEGDRVATLKVALSGPLLRAAGRAEQAADVARTRFMMELADEARSVPGVVATSFAADLPLDGGEYNDFIAVDGAPPSGLDWATKALRGFVGPRYFEVIGARLAAGREMRASDFAGQPRVALVNRAFAESRFPKGEAVGHRLMQWSTGIDPTKDVWYTIVGVVDDIRETTLMTPPVPTVYLPTMFLPEGDFAMWMSNLTLLVRTEGDPAALLAPLERAVAAAHPEVPINTVATLGQIAARSFQQVSFAMTLLAIAGAAALLLGVVGVYGTMSYLVGRRRREFGLRIALGATGARVRREVLLTGGRDGLLGVVVGLGVALFASKLVGSLLFGISAGEPLVFMAVAAGLLGLVGVACLLPAARASAVDPVDAMRAD